MGRAIRDRRNVVRVKWAIIGTTLIALVAMISYAFRDTQRTPRRQRSAQVNYYAGTDTPSIPPPSPAATRYLNASIDVAYIGSDACSKCHQEQYESYLQTAHSNSMSIVDAASQPPDGRYIHAATGLLYRSYRDDNQIRHREELTFAGKPFVIGDHTLKYLVGSGRFARTYLVERDGLLMESPLTWYEKAKEWALSPGFEELGHPSFSRAITEGCLGCHSGRSEQVSPKIGHHAIHELAIGCERCHGPGELHQAKWSGDVANTATEEDLTIVNPRGLSRELVDDICAQCHLHGDGQVVARGQRASNYRPGRRLSDYTVHYQVEPSSSGMQVVGHVEQMRKSMCYIDSDSLTCVSCHDPHRDRRKLDDVGYYRSKCLQCHDPEACGVELAKRQHDAEDNCIHCHMPQAPTEVTHVAFTHHRIGIHPIAAATDELPQKRLVPLADLSKLSRPDQQRVVGLAHLQQYALHADDSKYHSFRQLAAASLTNAAPEGISDAETMLALATLASLDNNTEETRRLIKRGLGGQPMISETRLKFLGLAVDDAIASKDFRQLKHLISQRMKLQQLADDWLLLGAAELQTQHLDQAIAALERAIELDPLQLEAYQPLGELYEAQGYEAAANRLRERFEQLMRLEANPP